MTTPAPTYTHTDSDGDRLEAWQLRGDEAERPRIIAIRPGGPDPKWWELAQGRKDGWRAVARHVLAGEGGSR